MNIQQNSEIANERKNESVHAIPEGTKPGQADANVGPLPGLDSFFMSTPINLLEHTAEQKLLRFNQEYERAIAFYEATTDAQDAADYGTPERERADNACGHANRILKEIEASAYAIPAHTAREVGLKARIMSYSKGPWWDTERDEQDSDARFLIEDVLGLAGLGRIERRDFAFADLLPGYAGPARVAPQQVLEPVKAIPHSPIHALAVEARDLWDLYSRIDERKVREKLVPTVLENDMKTVIERTDAIERQVAYMRPETLADAMFQLALVNDAVDAMGNHDTKESRSAARMIAGIIGLLSKLSGFSLHETGVDAYAKNLVALEAEPLQRRYDPDRFDRSGRLHEQQAAA